MDAKDVLYSNDYFTLYGDGRFGCSDGTGYIGEVEGDAETLFSALETYIHAMKKGEGVKPIAINSSLVSAHNRPRLYWTNIPNVGLPTDLGYVIGDVITPNFSTDYPKYLNGDYCGKTRKDLVKLHTQKASCLTATMYKGQISSFCKDEGGMVHKYTPEECEVLQTLPVGYTSSVSNTQRYKTIGNGWTVDVIAHILRGME